MSKPAQYSAVFITAYFVTLVLNYIFGVSLSWFLTPDQFGILGVAQSLLLLIALAVGSGFAWTTNHDLAVQGLSDNSRRRFRTAFIANVLLGTGIAILLWISYQTGLLPLGPGYKSIIPLLALTTVLLSARSVINGAARGLTWFNGVALNLVAEVVVKISFGILLVALGVGVAGVMLGFAIGAALSLIHSLWITRRDGLWRGSGWFELRVVRDTAPIFIGMISTALMLNLDVIGLKLLAPPGQGDQMAGYYQAAVILSRAPVFIAQAVTLVLFSYVAKSSQPDQGENDRSAQKSYLFSLIRTWYRLLLPVSLILVLAPGSILSIFFPPEYSHVSGALQVAGVGTIVLALVTLLNGYLQAAGNRNTPAVATGFASLLQIFMMLIFVPRLGITGAAFSLLIASLAALIALLPAIQRYLPYRMSHNRLHIHRLAALSAPMIGLALPIFLLPNHTLSQALLQLISASVVYIILVMIIQRQSIRQDKQPAGHLFTEFIRVFLGG